MARSGKSPLKACRDASKAHDASSFRLDPRCQPADRHFGVGLKYFKFGGAWFLLVGIRKPPALSM